MHLFMVIMTVKCLQDTTRINCQMYTAQVNTVYLQRVEKTYMEWVTISLILQTAMEKLYFHLFSLTLICMERVAGSTVVLTVYMKTR